jgi:hypothetical protein
VIDIFTSEDMENMSLCIFQYLALYYIINCCIQSFRVHVYVDLTITGASCTRSLLNNHAEKSISIGRETNRNIVSTYF